MNAVRYYVIIEEVVWEENAKCFRIRLAVNGGGFQTERWGIGIDGNGNSYLF